MIKYWSKWQQEFYEYKTMEVWMLNPYVYSFYRHMRYKQSNVEFERGEDFKKENEINFKNRPCRNKANLNGWSIEPRCSIASSKCWKNLYKVRKQYMKRTFK